MNRLAVYMLFAICLALPLATNTVSASDGVPVTSKEHVVMQITLIRHGIRAPTKSPEVLAIYATRPWPTWSVPPGQLTSHGAKLMRSLGDWYRRALDQEGLLFAACLNTAELKVIADSTPRNRASAVEFIKGFSPNCKVGYSAFDHDYVDPLFHGHTSNRIKDTSSPKVMPYDEINNLQKILLGCNGSECIQKARSSDKVILLNERPASALKQAGSLAENIMLIYAEGMPMSQVGWGLVDAKGIEKLIDLHNISFAVNHVPLPKARARGGNMLAYIAATMAVAANTNSDLHSLAPKGTHALFLVGHDTDLASQAGLLGLDWKNIAQPDNYPPGGALIFQLLESEGKYAVRLSVALPTLTALRAADVEPQSAMYVSALRLKSCGNRFNCPLSQFLEIVDQAVPEENILRGSGEEPLAH